jgi:hypothetical protein
MVKIVRPAILIFLLFFIIPEINGQEQISFPEYLSEHFRRYLRTDSYEQIYVHTDREDYIAGEDMWFNIYVTDSFTGKPSLNSKIAYIELFNKNNHPVVQKRFRIENGCGPGQIILPDSLSSGPYLLRVYTNWMKNFLPSNCFMKNINVYNAFIPGTFKRKLNVWEVKGKEINTTEKEIPVLTLRSPDSIRTRDIITIEIELNKEIIAASGTTNLSVSVTPSAISLGVMDYKDYIDFYNLSILSPILSGDLPALKYKTENDEHYLSGRLVNRDPQVSNSNKILYLSIPGKTAVFEYARTDNEGNFNFAIPVDELPGDLIIRQAVPENGNSIKMESPFSEVIPKWENQVDSVITGLPYNISKLSINYQVGKIYGSSYKSYWQAPDTPLSKQKRFYGKPDIELVLADYIKLPVMQEIFFELLQGVHLKTRKSGYEISINNPIDNKSYNIPPVVMIDGVIIDDLSLIINLDPEKVEKIDVVKAKYAVGDYIFYGILNVITKEGNYENFPLSENAVRLRYRVCDPVNLFSFPDYSTAAMKESRIPDLRNTLYWNPSIKPDKDGKSRIEFWASDYISDYEINIQGITADGKVVSLKKTIRIY